MVHNSTNILISKEQTHRKPHVDTVTTNKWFSSNLKGDTEGLLVAAQDQAINTRNYQKVILWPASGEQMQNVFAI